MRRLLSLLIAGLLGLSGADIAQAGSADRYHVIGFGNSRSVFLFEVFGVFDALGGGHSTIYAVDLPTDSWLPGTPIRTVIGDGNPELYTATLAQIRRRTMALAGPLLEDLGPFDQGERMAARAFGQIGVPADELVWRDPATGNLPYLSPETYVLELATFVAGTADFFGDCLGYALSLNGTEFHRDQALPESRGCPLAYELEEVICRSTCVAIIAVFDHGFEGWDRYYIAAPLR